MFITNDLTYSEDENITFAEGDVLMKLNCEITLTPAEFDLSDTVVW